MFYVQACYSDGRIISERFEECSESDAIGYAKAELKHPTSEAEYVRVLTIDCELVYDSREDYARDHVQLCQCPAITRRQNLNPHGLS